MSKNLLTSRIRLWGRVCGTCSANRDLSVKNNCPVIGLIGRKAHLYLFLIALLLGQRRKFLFGKISAFCCLDIFGKFASKNLAQVEYFYHSIRIRRGIVLIPVLNSYDLLDKNVQPGFFFCLLDDIVCRREIEFAPPIISAEISLIR